MIRYTLHCAKGHDFEGWFRSSDDFDAQVKRKLVACPNCGGTKVEKALMAPSVQSSKRRAARKAPADAATTAPDPGPSAGVPAAVAAAPQLVASPEQREALKMMRALREEILKSSDDVGPRFAEEARRMHNDEAPKRGIHGEAAPAEVKALLEEGIEVYPLPVLPEDKN